MSTSDWIFSRSIFFNFGNWKKNLIHDDLVFSCLITTLLPPPPILRNLRIAWNNLFFRSIFQLRELTKTSFMIQCSVAWSPFGNLKLLESTFLFNAIVTTENRYAYCVPIIASIISWREVCGVNKNTDDGIHVRNIWNNWSRWWMLSDCYTMLLSNTSWKAFCLNASLTKVKYKVRCRRASDDQMSGILDIFLSDEKVQPTLIFMSRNSKHVWMIQTRIYEVVRLCSL